MTHRMRCYEKDFGYARVIVDFILLNCVIIISLLILFECEFNRLD